MSLTVRPRRAFVSSSGDSIQILPHSMGWIHDLRNLRELLSHLRLSHKIRLLQDMGRFIVDRDRHSIRVNGLPDLHREVLKRVFNIAYAGYISGSLPSSSPLTVPRSPLTEPILWTISPNCSTVSRRSSACSRQIWLRRDVLISFRICTHSFAKTVAVCVSRASKAFVHLSRRVWSRDSIWAMLRSNFVVWVRSL